MGDPLTLAAAGAAVGGAGSVYGASKQNAAIKRSMDSTVSQTKDALSQLQLQTAIATQRYANDARKVRGSIRVAAAGAGMSGADLAALQRQAAFDADLNTRIAKASASNQAAGITSRADAQLSQLKSAGQNSLFEGIAGAIRGGISGYSIGSMFGDPATTVKDAADPSGGWQSALYPRLK